MFGEIKMSEKSLECLALNEEGKFIDMGGKVVHANIVKGPFNLSVQADRLGSGTFVDAPATRVIEAVRASAPENANAYIRGLATEPVANANYAVYNAYCRVPILYLRIESEPKTQ